MSKNRNRNQNKVNAQDHAPDVTEEVQGQTAVTEPVDESPVELAPEDTNAEQTQDEVVSESTLDSAPVDAPVESETAQSEVEVAAQPVVTAKVTAPAPTAKVNLPNQNRSQVGDPKYVSQVTTPAQRFIEVALKKDHSVQEFNSCKVNVYNSLRAAIRYPDANNFIGSMNAFLQLVREHRDTAFHETTFNMYTHRIELSEQALKELPRLMSVFQVLASPDAKNIGKLVDFSSVFLTKVPEEQIARFRMWALR